MTGIKNHLESLVIAAARKLAHDYVERGKELDSEIEAVTRAVQALEKEENTRHMKGQQA